MKPTYCEFALASTWVFELACVDQDGNPLNLTGGAVQLRVASPTALIIDMVLTAEGEGFSTGAANLVVAPADQAGIEPGLFRYETRALVASGLVYPQRWGNLQVRDSLYAQFPYTPPSLNTPGKADFSKAVQSGLFHIL